MLRWPLSKTCGSLSRSTKARVLPFCIENSSDISHPPFHLQSCSTILPFPNYPVNCVLFHPPTLSSYLLGTGNTITKVVYCADINDLNYGVVCYQDADVLASCQVTLENNVNKRCSQDQLSCLSAFLNILKPVLSKSVKM